MATKTKAVNRIAALEPSANGQPAEKSVKLVIPSPNTQTLEVWIEGISPLIIRAWDQKTAQMLADKQAGKGKAKGRKPEVANETFEAAKYYSTEGWEGIAAGSFKAALVDAVSCLDISRTDFSMTLAKKCFFILPDGVCRASGRDLVRIHGKSERYDVMQPTSGGGPYMSFRPRYPKWKCRLRVQFNASKIDAQGVLNLLATAGYYCGVGEHRPSAKESRTGSSGRWKVLESEGTA